MILNTSSVYIFLLVLLAAIVVLIVFNLIVSRKRLLIVFKKTIDKNERLFSELESVHSEVIVLKEELKAQLSANVELKQFKTNSLLVLDEVLASINIDSGSNDNLDVYKRTQINNIVLTNKLERGEYNTSKEQFVISELLSKMLSDINIRRTIKIKTPNKNLKIKSDYKLLYQVLLNLTLNALLYSDAEKTIDIELVESLSDQIEIHIIDKGCGIAKKHQSIIFNKYFKLNTESGMEVPRLGLGLYFAKLALLAIDSEISLRSKPDEGTNIWISLNNKL